MTRHVKQSGALGWVELVRPEAGVRPRHVTIRGQSLPPRSLFAAHSHSWHQLVYATEGVLTVWTKNTCFVVSPKQAVWLPALTVHSVGSERGAMFRSLYVSIDAFPDNVETVRLIDVGPLLRALIIECASNDGSKSTNLGYRDQLEALIVAQLHRAPAGRLTLPWPIDKALLVLCAAIQQDPSDRRGLADWAKSLGVSERTLARRFERNVGITFRAWRSRARTYRAIELLEGHSSITEIAFDLGYSSASAFIVVFKEHTGISPSKYRSVGRANK